MSKLPELVTQYPPPPNQPDFYHQYRKEDITNNSLYDVNFQPNPKRIYKNRSALVIDSRDRVSGTPDCYEYIIDDLYYDVISVELKLADIPNSTYLVNETNNQFYFQDSERQVRTGEFYHVRPARGRGVRLPARRARGGPSLRPAVARLPRRPTRVTGTSFG